MLFHIVKVSRLMQCTIIERRMKMSDNLGDAACSGSHSAMILGSFIRPLLQSTSYVKFRTDNIALVFQ